MIPGARVIRWAARLVPRERRGPWRSEWEAEVAYSWRRMHRDGRPSVLAAARLYLRITSCVIDALWERKETMTMGGLTGDLRHALRGLARRPTFLAIVVLTLGLGIGATTAVFTIVDGVLLKPLPFDDPDAMVAMRHQGREGRDPLPMSQGMYLVYREHAASLEEVAMWSGTSVNLVADGEPQRIRVQAVTPSFFTVLGVSPVLGRTFTEAEGAPDAERVVVLSDGFWRTSLGADPAIIGKSLDVNGSLRQVVGVMPPGFGFPDREARLWLPLVVDPAQAPLAAFGPNGIGRLAPGSTVQSLQTDVDGLITRLPELFPESGSVRFLQEVNLTGIVAPLKAELVGDIGKTLWILFGTVGFVLLIACANVANLLLVRAEGRTHELALRVAVGASRMHVLRWFLTESVLLAALGGVVGTAIAWFAVRASLALAPPGLPRVAEIGVDVRVMGFSAAVSLGCALFFGLFPLIRYGLEDLAGQLREATGRGSTGGHGPRRLRSGLVIAQMALALVLLIGSGLMLRSFQAMRALDPGFDRENVLTARLTVPTAEIEGWEETAGFFRQLQDRLAAQSGVEAVGFGQAAPLASGLGFFSFEVEDQPRTQDELPVFATHNSVEGDFFEAMGIDVLQGRLLQRGDGAEDVRGVVVSRSFAEHWWPEESPLGRRVRLGYPNEEWWEIVGVAEDVRFRTLEDDAESLEMVYWPATLGPAGDPQPTRSMDLTMKTATAPEAFVALLRREVAELNPRIPVSNPRTMEDVFRTATARTSFTMVMLGSASSIALVLGLVGIYGVISYLVSRRTREIGVRMALGASGPTVRGMVVREGMVLAVAGIVIGLLAAGGLSRLMASLLFGVRATDPTTYATVAVSMVTVALAASWLPALRASKVDPARALRAD